MLHHHQNIVVIINIIIVMILSSRSSKYNVDMLDVGCLHDSDICLRELL